ncbi:ABC transporter substrate-binding protein [Compostimonas suwonensis]|uniref:ABC-type glycerol-3-phosphate transport system substrate-binding protein n=1 Tax=Compostimonas suwonensis TaxID=1048394 RepID=A0A2M9BVM8_9MICO|nr:extracellular solute-binding protein [Compostimonas suwonensis]PJJ62006.1 ABC-type glycerol-3-phosphate transport system substrate-binding protein [Compostimonas suwonensis]
MKSPRSLPARSRRALVRSAVAVLAVSAIAALAGCASADQSTDSGSAEFTPVTQEEGSTITVWADSTRLPAVQQYQDSHPDAKLDIVTYDGGADGSTYLQTKVQLFDRTGEGWPDVVFAPPVDVTWASQPTGPDAIPFAAPLDEDLVPQDTLDDFATGSLTPCEFNGHTYCLRNDIAQVVLWYNKTLLDQFGYSVPTTWEEYEALGEKVAAEHPGYLVGSVGDTNSHESYFWSSQCPAFDLVKPDTLRVDLQDGNCTRMATLLDNLIAKGAVSTEAFFSQGFAKDSGAKTLVAVGPSWYGQYLFNSAFAIPAGQIAAAPPLGWEGESENFTGNVGGGTWMVSSHSANLDAATDLVTWITTSDDVQAGAPTYPAFAPAADAWLANPANKEYFANDVSDAFKTAADEVWTGWSNTRFSDATAWSSVVLPALTAGKTLTETLPAWQTAITDEAKSVGYTVTQK